MSLHVPDSSPDIPGLDGDALRPRWGRILLLAVALWTVVGLFVVGQTYVHRVVQDLPPPPRDQSIATLWSCWLWALFTPPMVWLSRKLPVDRGRLLRHGALHLVLALAISAVDVLVDIALGMALGIGAFGRDPVALFFAQLFLNVFSYLAVAAITHAGTYYRLYDDRRVRAAALETQLLRAQMQALERQLQPHFLFNTLHAVAGAIRVGQQATAIRMLAGLGDLLRMALRSDGRPEIPLGQELDFIERYLAIEQIRFEDRLRVTIDVDAELRQALVPGWILQPLVENALRHGIGASANAGELEIRAAEEQGRLWLRVCNTGPGTATLHREARPGGIGLHNTRARLHHLYGDDQALALTPTADGGMLVEVNIPLRRSEAAAGPPALPLAS